MNDKWKRVLFGQKRTLPLPLDALDEVLITWPDGTPFTVRDLLMSICIFGKTGSGKSTGSNLLFARAIAALKNSGGLILVSKPEDKQFWIDIFTVAGRIQDLLIFGPSEPLRCNYVDFEMKSGGDARSLTQFIMITGEAISGGTGKDSDPFWRSGQQRMIYNAIVPLRLGRPSIKIPEIQRFISTALYNPAQLTIPEQKTAWEKGFHNEVMLAANEASKKETTIEKHDFAGACDYWTNEFLHMDNKPRSSILAGVMNVLHTLNTGIVRELVSTTTNVTPAILAQGKFLLMNCPLDDLGESAKIIMHGMKFLTQKYILRRAVKPGDSVICIHADEAQEMVSSFDAAFLAKCRSHYGAMIYLTQSIHSYMTEEK